MIEIILGVTTGIFLEQSFARKPGNDGEPADGKKNVLEVFQDSVRSMVCRHPMAPGEPHN